MGTDDIKEMCAATASKNVRFVIETGGSNGMVTLDQSLEKLVRDGAITPRAALGLSRYPSQLKQRIGVI